MKSMLKEYSSVVDQTQQPRELLEKKAHVLDCLELHIASVYHGCSDLSLDDFIAVFEDSGYENYFTKSTK